MHTIFGGKTQISDGSFGTSEAKARFRSGDFFAQSHDEVCA